MGKQLTITKEIPENLLSQYVNLGWSRVPSSVGSTVISKVVQTGNSVSNHIDLEWRAPCYVQRGKIRRPVGYYQDETLSRAVDLDYMGSAEFEFGALSTSLRCVESQLILYKLHVVDSIPGYRDGKTHSIRLFANFDTEEQLATYVAYLKDMVAGKLQMKESTYMKLELGAVAISDRCDFWWDIRNNVFMSFDKQFMSRIINHVHRSIQVLSENAVPEEITDV